MARVKDQDKASSITIVSKNRRWARLVSLFGIKRLSELFPANAVPNDAGNDHLKCSGDVLRDLCMIGEALKARGMTKEQMRRRIKRSFTPGIQVRHADVRELLERIRNSTLQMAVNAGYDKKFVATQTHEFNVAASNLPATDAVESAQDDDSKEYNKDDHQEDQVKLSNKSNTIGPHDQLQDEPPETTHHSEVDQVIGPTVEGEGEEPQHVHTAPTHFSIFDQIEPDGLGRVHGSLDIAEVMEMEDSGDEHNGRGQEGQIEYEEDEVITARTASTTINSKYLSSLRPANKDGFADTYVPGQQNIQKIKAAKRKSAPATLEGGCKRSRSSFTPSRIVYDQSERDTLVSCLRMAYALLGGIDKCLDEEDLDGAQKQVGVVQGMVEQVLTKYAD